jgi:hypothetical protein
MPAPQHLCVSWGSKISVLLTQAAASVDAYKATLVVKRRLDFRRRQRLWGSRNSSIYAIAFALVLGFWAGVLSRVQPLCCSCLLSGHTVS